MGNSNISPVFNWKNPLAKPSVLISKSIHISQIIKKCFNWPLYYVWGTGNAWGMFCSLTPIMAPVREFSATAFNTITQSPTYKYYLVKAALSWLADPSQPGPHCKGTEQVLVGGWLKDGGFKKDYLAPQTTCHNLSSLFEDSRLFIPKLKAGK